MTRSAAETYTDRRAEVDEQIRRLREALAAHRARAASRPEDWGYAGDLGRLATILDEGLSAVGAGEGERR